MAERVRKAECSTIFSMEEYGARWLIRFCLLVQVGKLVSLPAAGLCVCWEYISLLNSYIVLLKNQ